MFNKKILAASMAAAISTGMVAQVHAIKVQENNTGQALLGPMYITGGGLNSEITVVNTRTDAAVKAKIVFREGITSSEVLDFILYLTPGDVWRGTIVGETSAARIVSIDDSMTDNNGNFGSVDNPVDQPLFDKESTGSNGYGHFEVFGVYSITIGSTNVDSVSTPGSKIVVKPGMTKPDLRNLFNTIDANPVSSANIGAGEFPARVSTRDPEYLQMMGEVQMVNGENALASYVVPALGPTHTFDEATYVVSNPDFNAFLSLETNIGEGFSAFGDGDNIAEIETAIATVATSFTYNVTGSNITAAAITFPTKYRHREDTFGVGGCEPGTLLTDGTYGYSSPFEDTHTGEIVFSFISFDNSENSEEVIDGQFSGGDAPESSSLPYEVNLVVPNFYSPISGWAQMGYLPNVASGFVGARQGCEYQGVPALSATLKTKGANFLWTDAGERRSMMYLAD